MYRNMEIERITYTDHPLFPEAMELYEISFPAHEQREALSQSEILSSSAYHFDVICDGGEFVGEILYWEIGDFLYVEHFCVHPSMRNKHYGQRILEAYQAKPLILEIDPPVDEISRRRQGFYERCGFVANPYGHVHPPYHRGCEGHKLVVMSSPDQLSQSEYDMFNEFLQNTIMKDAFR